ncbi:MAG: hypothetical protein ABII26_04330 [Pseudomonadota bacterium]
MNSKKIFLYGVIIFGLSMIFSSQTGAKTYRVKDIKTITTYGKSLDWSNTKNLIASAAMQKDGYYDIFVMEPDGSNKQCLTCRRQGVPQKHNGNPVWHPSGEYIVFTAEKKNNLAKYKEWAIPGTGFNCDLWVMTSDGQHFYQLTDYPLKQPFRAVIHPQFSHDGKKLFWAERVKQGKSFGGGWLLKIADFVVDNKTIRLENIEAYSPGEWSCFYESHAFSKDNKKVLFSGNLKAGQISVGLDIYEFNLETQQLKRLTHSNSDWDEHAHHSPDGTKIAWMSSTGLNIKWGDDISGHKWGRYLKTELWMMDVDGSDKQRLTFLNTPGHQEYMGGARGIVSDSTWSPDGKSIAALVAHEAPGGKLKTKIVMITLEKD